MASIDQQALNISDLRELARRRLPRGIFEFIERGSEDDVAINNNRTAFGKYSFRPQVLKDVSRRHIRTELFGRTMSMPIVMGPTGAAGLVWHDGELALAKAAANAGVPFTLSTASLTSIERVAAEAPGRLWFQLYMWPDRSMSHDLVKRVQAVGYEALVVTVDTPVGPNREFNTRNGFGLPFRLNRKITFDILLHSRWFCSVILRYMLTTGMPHFENFPSVLQRSLTEAAPKGNKAGLPKNDSLTWADFDELRRIWKGPLIIKGILHPDDADIVVRHGADAIIVSNHGGRNLDASIAPFLALPEIVDRVGARVSVLVDGGIFRGSDVAKALAMGASAVLVGRAPLWGAAAAGTAGAARALAILGEELTRVIGLLGCAHVGELGRHLLWRDSQSAPFPGSLPATSAGAFQEKTFPQSSDTEGASKALMQPAPGAKLPASVHF